MRGASPPVDKDIRNELNAKTFATSEEIERARQAYGSTNLEIEDGAETSEADDGLWVAAWVWLDRNNE